MKVRKSGMPEVAVWESFFDPEAILTRLSLTSGCKNAVEFGCGYGTFTIPAARRVRGTVFALDIEPSMLAVAKKRATQQGIENIDFVLRDFITHGTGLPDGSAGYAMLFNILHHEEPVSLLREAFRNLQDGGLLGVIHWIHDSDTPRGPPLSVRPRPEQCCEWAEAAGFAAIGETFDLPPYHYGLLFRRDAEAAPAKP